MRALIIVPIVIAAVIGASNLLAKITGDMISAVVLELIICVTLVALLTHEPKSSERAFPRRHDAGRATLS